MKTRHILTSALALIAMTACSDSDATSVEAVDLQGTWSAASMVVTSVADPSLTADLIALGTTVSVMFAADGTYTVTINDPGIPTETETGTYSVSGSTLTLVETFEGQVQPPEEITIILNGNSMTLTMDDHWDFDDNGTDDPAIMVVGLTRSSA